MWEFLKRQNKKDNTNNERHSLQFSEIVAEMGDFSDLKSHDVALKFWLPEAGKQALSEMSERSNLSSSELLRQFLAVHCYGLYAYYQMADEIPMLFKDRGSIKFSRAQTEPPEGKKRVDTYWIPELGKNIAPVKIWIPKRMKIDLQVLAEHTKLTLSNYIREILLSRLLGHGTLPQRPEMFRAFPAPSVEKWCKDEPVSLHEVSKEDYLNYGCVFISEIRTEWIDSTEDD